MRIDPVDEDREQLEIPRLNIFEPSREAYELGRANLGKWAGCEKSADHFPLWFASLLVPCVALAEKFGAPC